MKKKVTWTLGILGAFAVGWYLFVPSDGGVASEKEVVREAKVERGDLRLTVAATGEVKPLRIVELKSKASGQVVRFAKEVGEPVSVGELIAALDRALEERNLRKAKADRDTAQARLALTKLEYARSLSLAETELASAEAEKGVRLKEIERKRKLGELFSRQEVAAAELELILAKGRVARARAELKLIRGRKEDDEKLASAALVQAAIALEDAEERLRDVEIRSPIDGILLKKEVEEGQIVASGISATSGGTPIAQVADTSVMIVETHVDETDVGRIRVGQEAEIKVDAEPDRPISGKVDLIPPLGELESNLRVYKVRVLVAGEDVARLRAGYTAGVEILYDVRKNVLSVPIESVRKEGDQYYVYVPDSKSRKRVDIRIGRDDGERVEVLEGLDEDAEILIVNVVTNDSWK